VVPSVLVLLDGGDSRPLQLVLYVGWVEDDAALGGYHGRNGSGARHGTCGDDCDRRVQAPGDHRPVCITKFLETHLVYSVC
jgi:hypothetical protein